MRLLSLLVLACLPALPASAQELNCRVTINYDDLQDTDVNFLDQFGLFVEDYLNNQTWTNDRFEEVERIGCTFQIRFSQRPTQNSFVARLVVTSSRPIYGTRQSTRMLNISDTDWAFDYIQGQSLTRDFNRFDRLTSVLDYYAFLILGYDYDSFAPLGGTPFFEQAQTIVDLAQAEGAAGWTSFGADRVRSQIAQEMTDPRFGAVRQAYYTVHRLGVDAFIEDQEAVRVALLETLRALEGLRDQAVNSYVLDVFFDTKADAMVGMLTGSAESTAAYALLLELDPTNASKYQEIVN